VRVAAASWARATSAGAALLDDEAVFFWRRAVPPSHDQLLHIGELDCMRGRCGILLLQGWSGV